MQSDDVSIELIHTHADAHIHRHTETCIGDGTGRVTEAYRNTLLYEQTHTARHIFVTHIIKHFHYFLVIRYN